MSPEEPGAPDDAQRSPGTPTFRPGVEPAHRPGLTGDAPDPSRPSGPSAPSPSPPSRPGDAPVPPGPGGADRPAAGSAGAPSAAPQRSAGTTPPTPAERTPATDADGPRKVVAPTRRRLLDDPDPDPDAPPARRKPKVRHRKVTRIVRHVEPWSVLKISVLFFLSIFLIICVASAVLWNAARSAGVIEDVESFVTSLGFGNCEDIEPEGEQPPETTTTIDGADPQLGGSSSTDTTVAAPEDEVSTIPDEDGECAEGQRLVGGFKFEDERIFQSFALFGIVLVLSGAAASVVMAMLFNLISDLTGGMRVTVLEEDTPRSRTGSPPGRTDG